MKRVAIDPRVNWQKRVEEVGLVFHTAGKPYWNEAVYYSFSLPEIETLECATAEVQKLCLEAVQTVITNDWFDRLAIPECAIARIKESWENEFPSVYGRFDFAFNGYSAPKLLEYNADTPASLLEAAVVQWHWLQERFPVHDQFNSIHERLVAKWRELQPFLSSTMYFGSSDDVEDVITANYMRETAHQAGIQTQDIRMMDIGWNERRRCFTDLAENQIKGIFKFYPWEWILAEPFGPNILATYEEMVWIEPIWKMVLSNKGILPILWELFPGHPNLLEAHKDSPQGLREYVRKPLLSREGANVMVYSSAGLQETTGECGKEGCVYQALARLPCHDGVYPVIGSWVIDGEAAGMGIRESVGLITDGQSQFVPHIIE